MRVCGSFLYLGCVLEVGCEKGRYNPSNKKYKMIIAHLPLGYLLTKATAKIIRTHSNTKGFMVAGLVGSVCPDFDMLYFHFIDNGRHHHHDYWTHIPLFWFGVLLLLAGVCKWLSPKHLPLIIVFGVNVIAHLITDTLVGDIKWLYPFNDAYYAFFTVPARYQPWWLNFILHWTFLLELSILLTAICFFRKYTLYTTILTSAITIT